MLIICASSGITFGINLLDNVAVSVVDIFTDYGSFRICGQYQAVQLIIRISEDIAFGVHILKLIACHIISDAELPAFRIRCQR
ncbi:hypothetical protein D3C75_614650 [compost metagenome]